jgi:triosephosphate isomerase
MDDETVAATVTAVARADMVPIICVGESAALRESGEHIDFVTGQLRSALGALGAQSFVVAYEPLWAIGTGASASTEQIAEMASALRGTLNDTQRESTPILYGGSVSSETAAELASHGGVDGFLVGGASLRAEEFVAIVVAANGCYGGTR